MIAKPNRAHMALAELGRKMGEGSLTVSQNVDGKSDEVLLNFC